MAVSQTLLEEAKNFLDITWADEADDAKLAAQLERGISYLTLKTGVTDYETNSLAKDLLFNRLLYDRAGSLDKFAKNYRGEILCLALQFKTQGDGTDASDTP